MRQLMNGNVPVERTRLSENTEEAVDQTVKRMAEIAYGEFGSRSPKIRALAINIVRTAGVPEKDYYGELLAIHSWIKKNIRYVRDPVNQETLSHPEETAFNSMAGDCDDMVVLEMALLGAIGIKSHPVVVGMQPGMYSHVYLRATVPPGRHRMAGKTISLDPIMKNWPAGREAPKSRVKARKDYKQLEALMMLNGYDADVGDVWSSVDGGSNLGAYASGPSYLDDEYSGAESIMVTQAHTPDITHDLVLSNTPKAVQSKEGVDGMFGLGLEMEATDPQGPEAMFSRGPIVNWQAKKMHTALAPGGKYIRKHYEGGEMEARMRMARGKAGANAAASPNRKIVTVNDGKKQATPQNAPLTIQEQSDELDGLHGMIVEKTHGIRLAGLGAEEDPATQEAVKEAATLSWFARFKAKTAAARAGWLEQKAENMTRMGNSEAAKAAVEKAKAQRKLAKKAIEVAKEGVGLEKAAEKASPNAKGQIKKQQAELEVAQQEEPVAAEADEKPSLEGFFDRFMRGNDSWRERRLKLLRTRRERLEKKIQALEAQAKKVDNKVQKANAVAAKRQERIEAPVNVREMNDPSKRGRRNAMRGRFRPAAPANEAAPREGVIVPQQWEATDPNVNKRAMDPTSVNGLGGLPTINTPIAALNSPLVQYGALAAGLYFFLKR